MERWSPDDDRQLAELQAKRTRLLAQSNAALDDLMQEMSRGKSGRSHEIIPVSAIRRFLVLNAVKVRAALELYDFDGGAVMIVNPKCSVCNGDPNACSKTYSGGWTGTRCPN